MGQAILPSKESMEGKQAKERWVTLLALGQSQSRKDLPGLQSSYPVGQGQAESRVLATS